MKIILLYVASLDGKLTKWDHSSIHEWISQEDAAHFQTVRDHSKLIVMGIHTFTDAQPTPTPSTLRVIMTKDADNYTKQTIPGQLEFSSETPTQLVERLAQKGYDEMLLLSGQRLTTAFFHTKLIDELWLTVEPRIFGTGKALVNEEKIDISLQLLQSKQLNVKGTLLLKYKVLL